MKDITLFSIVNCHLSHPWHIVSLLIMVQYSRPLGSEKQRISQSAKIIVKQLLQNHTESMKLTQNHDMRKKIQIKVL